MLEIITILIGVYFITGIWLYVFSVWETWKLTSFWTFTVQNGHIGIIGYPKWLMFWLEWITKKMSERKNRRNK